MTDSAWLDLGDGGPLIRCRDAAHAQRLGEHYLVMRGPPDDPTAGIRARIEALAAAGIAHPPAD